MPTMITGCSGFIGLALTEILLERGEAVVGIDLAPLPAAAQRRFARLPGRLMLQQGDVRDEALLLDLMRRHAPRRLVTLAAVTADAQRERTAPFMIFDVNLGGMVAAFSAAANAGVKRVLHISSGSVYGASGAEPGLLDEARTPLRPEGLYGISKQAAEMAALRLAELHALDLSIGRLGTCFGPWEADTGVRDTLSAPYQVVQLARQGGTAVLPRASRRDWLYVRDAVAAALALLERSPGEDGGRIFNLSAGFEWSVADWCEQMALRYPEFAWRLAAPGEPANIDFYAPYDRASMSTVRLRAATGFVPRFGLAAAAADFHAWLEGQREPAI